jgi:predicted XRE-type DNA-binding protein
MLGSIGEGISKTSIPSAANNIVIRGKIGNRIFTNLMLTTTKQDRI